jgi:hypothetical protein
MNKLIRELAEQATTKHTSYFDGRGNVTETYFDTEKFAELIVRQCGYYADVFEAVGCPVDMDPTETKPSDYIKKQLGIENE